MRLLLWLWIDRYVSCHQTHQRRRAKSHWGLHSNGKYVRLVSNLGKHALSTSEPQSNTHVHRWNAVEQDLFPQKCTSPAMCCMQYAYNVPLLFLEFASASAKCKLSGRRLINHLVSPVHPNPRICTCGFDLWLLCAQILSWDLGATLSVQVSDPCLPFIYVCLNLALFFAH